MHEELASLTPILLVLLHYKMMRILDPKLNPYLSFSTVYNNCTIILNISNESSETVDSKSKKIELIEKSLSLKIFN